MVQAVDAPDWRNGENQTPPPLRNGETLTTRIVIEFNERDEPIRLDWWWLDG